MSKLLNAKEAQARYNDNFVWATRFREVLPTILRIGEEMGAPDPRHLGVGHVDWRGSTGARIAHIGIMPGKSEIGFWVNWSGNDSGFSDNASDPTQVEAVSRRFFEHLIKRVSDNYRDPGLDA